MIRWLMAVLFGLVFVSSSVQAAQDPEQVVDEVFGQINSPFCKGRLLRDCPSSGASELKEEVKELALQGKSSREVVDLLYQRYGDEIRAVPTDDWVGVVAWLGPLVFLLVGGGVLGIWIRSRSTR